MSGSRKVFLYFLSILTLVLLIGVGSPLHAAPGDLVINEIIQNPNAVADTAGEWFEIHNITGSAIDIDGWTIKDDDTDIHVINNGGPLLVPAGGYLVLGNNDDLGTNGGAPVDYQYSSFTIANGDDEIVLLDSGLVEIDRVNYDGGPLFPDPTGASMALIDPALDNNIGANWCTAVTPFGDGDLGTPGAANDCPPPPLPQLVINEIMQNPDAVGDTAGEWFELYNAGANPVDIDGWTIQDLGTDSHVINNGGPLTIPAGGYLVLGNNADMGTNGGAPVDYQYSTFTIANGDDEILLLDTTLAEIDRVEYDGGPIFPDPTGASMALIDPAFDNNDGANWCTASTPFGDGDLGTPGAANDCPQPGSPIVINEIMQNPNAVFDDAGEWFEIVNTGDTAVDINGWTIKDDGSDSHVIDNGGPLLIPAGGYLVLGNNTDTGSNGGAPVDYSYGASWFLANGDDEVVLLDGTLTEIDRVNYDGGATFPDPTGASMSLEDPALDNNVGANWCTSVTPFGDGDLGTPGAANICTLPPTPATIMEIQGEAHTSPLENVFVETYGIVTVVRPLSFYIQDPAGDGNDNTSDGMLVFVGSAPAVAVGDDVTVTGQVVEFLPGSAAENLTITEINDPTVTINSSGNPVPAPVVIGSAGRIPPNVVIDDDSFATFDPANDGIDFYESLESMHVQVNDAQVTGSNFFGEIIVIGDLGANASLVTPRGGNVLSPGDFNPERILIDDAIVDAEPDVEVGDVFSAPILGIIDYSFGNFKLLNYDLLPAVVPSNIPREQTALEGTGTYLTVATFNVENLDPGDDAAKFADLADQIVNGMNSPAIIGLEEVQDNTGPTDDGVVDADQTYNALIAAITTAGGPLYEFRDIAPLDLMDGGEPGGNIRVGFLFRPDRVTYVDRPGGDATTGTGVALGANGVELTFSPGRIDPTNTAFDDSRKPLAGEFLFGSEKVIVVVNHFNSKGGDDPLFGSFQPPVFGSEVQRELQAQVVNDFVDDILALDPDANVVVMGDLNDFQFSNPIQTLKGGVLTNLIDGLPADEQYTYIFDGNSQVLDHILVSQGLANLLTGFDVVHANAEFVPDFRATDHDPAVAQFDFPLITNLDGCYLVALEGSPYTGPASIVSIGDPGYTPVEFRVKEWGFANGLLRTDCYEIHGTNNADRIKGDAGNDVIFGYDGDDTMFGKIGNDVFISGLGQDRLFGNEGTDEVLDFDPINDRCFSVEIGC